MGAPPAVEPTDGVFRRAFDQGPVGSALLSLEGRVIEANQCLGALVGTDDLHGRRVLDLLHPDDRAAAAAAVAAMLDGGAPAQTRTLRLLRAGDDAVPARVVVCVLRDASGQPSALLTHIDPAPVAADRPPSVDVLATDPVTGLPTQPLLVDRLERALARAVRDGSGIAVLCCDVDRLKRVNETMGHEAGDHVLSEVSARASAALRARDTAGRTAGGGLLVICEELAAAEDALAIAERVHELVSQPLRIGDRLLTPSVSIGIAFGGAGDDGPGLLRRAESALHQAKERGRGRAVLYDESIAVSRRRRLLLEDELRHAVDDEQLRLHHQPVIDLATGARLGHEALVRWQHPSHGLLQPGAFLDVAEESDLIVELGRWVLRRACEQAATAGYGHLAVNVSARQLQEPDFRREVEEALTMSGLDPARLVLELTETSLLRATPATTAGVEALTERGVRLAIDDFGTGYSSMTYLQRLPVAVVKIDRSFVADITGDTRRRAITQAVLAMGAALDLDVIAEGVETTEQADVLRELGCRYAQGYLFGRPAPLGATADGATADEAAA